MSGNLMDIFNSKNAPEIIGKPVFKNYIEKCKFLGADTPDLIIGKWIDEADLKSASTPLNFGSKKSTGLLKDEERIALFALKKAISNVQVQAQYKAKTQYPSKAVLESVPEYKRELIPLLKAFDITTWAEFIDQLQARF